MQENQTEFDVIVVGSGMAGGWAAKEFTEKGFKTLVLERGKHVEHGADYEGERLNPWDMKHRDKVTPEEIEKDYPVQSKCYAFQESTKQFFANDNELPYSTPEEKPYSWIRGNHLGGRSVLWQRQVYRWSNLDFEANKKDGHGVDWPIRYEDISQWYDYVEKFVGVSGSKENLAHVPDGQFQPAMSLNCVEEDIKAKLESKFSDRKLIIGRCAHLTKPTQEQQDLGRIVCQNRAQCQRGCSFGAYFSSLSATLPAAKRTGNMTLMSDMLVERLVYDEAIGKATGVKTIDTKTGARSEYKAKVIFVCASTLGTVQLLLNSTSKTFPDGFANSSGALGRYLMDHHFQVGATGKHPGFKDKYYAGRRPTGIYIPRFRNVDDKNDEFVRGYNFQGAAVRESWEDVAKKGGIGEELKHNVSRPGDWKFSINAFGETLPYSENRATLHPDKKDKWGIPQLHIDCTVYENEKKMRLDMAKTAREILESANLVDIETFVEEPVPGICIHEMGGARMGRDPKTSVLNQNNQCHDVLNVFITDGSAMTSSACQNPSLTYMALTARAVDFAEKQMQQGIL